MKAFIYFHCNQPLSPPHPKKIPHSTNVTCSRHLCDGSVSLNPAPERIPHRCPLTVCGAIHDEQRAVLCIDPTHQQMFFMTAGKKTKKARTAGFWRKAEKMKCAKRGQFRREHSDWAHPRKSHCAQCTWRECRSVGGLTSTQSFTLVANRMDPFLL